MELNIEPIDLGSTALRKMEEVLFNKMKIVTEIAQKNNEHQIRVKNFNEVLFEEGIYKLYDYWDDVSFKIQAQRDNPETATSERKAFKKFDRFLTPKINLVQKYFLRFVYFLGVVLHLNDLKNTHLWSL